MSDVRPSVQTCGEGCLPGQKVGRRWRFLKRAIDEWLGQRPDHLDRKAEDRG